MELEQKGYIDLERHNEDYLLARSLVEETGQNVFLTGRAGTGVLRLSMPEELPCIRFFSCRLVCICQDIIGRTGIG